MTVRALVLAAMILGAGFYGRHASGREQPVSRQPLSSLPRHVATWTMAGETPLEPDVLEVLGVDDYANRVYVDGAGAPVTLYVGYYASQRQGDTIHSPQNCLPGAGWQPVSSRRDVLGVGGRQVPVNQYVIQKGLDRQVVIYWYEGRGRIVANEYANKLWLMVDAARLHRSNGSLVRVMAPAPSGDGLPQAVASARAFARALIPLLDRYLP